jgi:hypothetical protein
MRGVEAAPFTDFELPLARGARGRNAALLRRPFHGGAAAAQRGDVGWCGERRISGESRLGPVHKALTPPGENDVQPRRICCPAG